MRKSTLNQNSIYLTSILHSPIKKPKKKKSLFGDNLLTLLEQTFINQKKVKK